MLSLGFPSYKSTSTTAVLRPQIHVHLPPPTISFGPRVFALSDLHTDYSENMAWIKCLSTSQFQNDLLLVAGDVAESFNNFCTTMSILMDKFQHVFYVSGNHDLWCRSNGGDKYLDPVDKLNHLLAACRQIGVKTSPDIIGGVGIIPLFSWYHQSFDKEKDITGIRIPSLEMACKDFHACKWPGELSSSDSSLSLFFDAMNENIHDQIEELRSCCRQMITFSHFLPRQELCPEKRMLFYPNLPKIIGSDYLEARLRSIHGTSGSTSACHVFGHTHFCWDAVIDGVSGCFRTLILPKLKGVTSNRKPIRSCILRYIQAPLGYPRERKNRMNGGENWLPFCVYANGGLTERATPCYWSDYYSINPRQPDNMELAPWVAKFYSRNQKKPLQ